MPPTRYSAIPTSTFAAPVSRPIVIILYLTIFGLSYLLWNYKLQNDMVEVKQHNLGVVKTIEGCPLRQPDANSNFVTFIIPSKGRDSIDRTIHSLFNQTRNLWKAVIVFDGEQQQITSTKPSYLSDPRITTYTIPKAGEANFAATLRNYGMSRVTCSEWFAFVDDDDVLSPEYVSRLLEETQINTLIETVIFRMSVTPFVLPPKDHVIFQLCHVGISFAIKRYLFEDGFWFKPSGGEDFNLLKCIFDFNKKMVISPYVTYYVKGSRPGESVEYPRINLN